MSKEDKRKFRFVVLDTLAGNYMAVGNLGWSPNLQSARVFTTSGAATQAMPKLRNPDYGKGSNKYLIPFPRLKSVPIKLTLVGED